MSFVTTDELSMGVTKLVKKLVSSELSHPTLMILNSFLTQ